MEKVMRVNIIVTTFNRINLTRICLETLLDTTGPHCKVTVVDNASSDGTVPYLEALAVKSDRITLYKLSRNMGVSVGVNLGLAMSDADYHLKLDNDIELRKPGWLEEMIAIAEGNGEVASLAINSSAAGLKRSASFWGPVTLFASPKPVTTAAAC